MPQPSSRTGSPNVRLPAVNLATISPEEKKTSQNNNSTSPTTSERPQEFKENIQNPPGTLKFERRSTTGVTSNQAARITKDEEFSIMIDWKFQAALA